MPLWAKVLIWIAIVAGALYGASLVFEYVKSIGYEEAWSKAERERAVERAGLADERARLIQEAMEAERQHAETLARVAERYEQELDAAAVESRELADDLRAGNVRLRRLWQGCETATRVPEAHSSPAERDEDARLRAEAAAAVVRVGAECDAHVRALQSTVRADRE